MSRPSLFFLVLAFLLNKTQVSTLSDRQDHFREINKDEILLTLEIPNGDIVDCIAKTEQDALNNHLFKNYTVDQSASRKGQESLKNETQTSMKETFQISFNMTTKCPKGSVPIVRTRRNNITKTKLVVFENKRHALNRHLVKALKFVNKNSSNEREDDGGTGGDGDDTIEEGQDDLDETVIVSIINLDARIKGVQVIINVWHPFLDESDNEFSSSHIQLQVREDIIGAGYHVGPLVTYDDQPRLFGYRTVRDESLSTGGYNFDGDGFRPVYEQQVRYGLRPWKLGDPVLPASIYGREDKNMLVSIYKGNVDGRKDAGWWLEVGNRKVGHWPIEDSTHLQGLATHVHMIGHVRNVRGDHTPSRHTRTQMGSGFFPPEGHQHSPPEGRGRVAYFANIIVMKENNMYVPVSREQLSTRVSSPRCYGVSLFNNFATDLGAGFFYGGPGYGRSNQDDCP